MYPATPELQVEVDEPVPPGAPVSRRDVLGLELGARRGEAPADADAARERQRLRAAAPKCGFQHRDSTACSNIPPCEVHGVEAGIKDCSSTLDSNPFTRCRKTVKAGELFCDCHKPFPDLGRRAAIYRDDCVRRGQPPRMEEFLAVHYPASSMPVVPIHDLAKYCESMRKKFAA